MSPHFREIVKSLVPKFQLPTLERGELDILHEELGRLMVQEPKGISFQIVQQPGTHHYRIELWRHDTDTSVVLLEFGHDQLWRIKPEVMDINNGFFPPTSTLGLLIWNQLDQPKVWKFMNTCFDTQTLRLKKERMSNEFFSRL
ncbi:MAG: hypothetical protein ABIJ33_02165 [Patescibacteria group bacterium]